MPPPPVRLVLALLLVVPIAALPIAVEDNALGSIQRKAIEQQVVETVNTDKDSTWYSRPHCSPATAAPHPGVLSGLQAAATGLSEYSCAIGHTIDPAVCVKVLARIRTGCHVGCVTLAGMQLSPTCSRVTRWTNSAPCLAFALTKTTPRSASPSGFS
jgi:hypothetical protein